MKSNDRFGLKRIIPIFNDRFGMKRENDDMVTHYNIYEKGKCIHHWMHFPFLYKTFIFLDYSAE